MDVAATQITAPRSAVQKLIAKLQEQGPPESKADDNDSTHVQASVRLATEGDMPQLPGRYTLLRDREDFEQLLAKLQSGQPTERK